MGNDNDNGNNNSDENEVKGNVVFERTDKDKDKLAGTVRVTGPAADLIQQAAERPTQVALNRSATQPTDDQALWVAIRNRTRAIGFDRYHKFINRVLCRESDTDESTEKYSEFKSAGRFGSPSLRKRREDLNRRGTLHGMDSYNLLKLATEAFLILECGLVDEKGSIQDPELIDLDAESRRLGRDVTIDNITTDLKDYLVSASNGGYVLPYLDRIVTQIVGLDENKREQKLPFCEVMLSNRLTCPSLIELIWSYWHEEAMLAQTINTIALRFQNKRLHDRDPLANLELDPLRPLNHILWGFIQDEYNRLSLQRRAYEYDHHYGFSLVGKAVPQLQSADSRSKFLEAFHNLLHRTALFYREDDDTTVIADAFQLLNALREVHLILAEGAHNQYGDLPWAARREMLMMQWLLARPETSAFLRGRYMVPYQEPWMGAVDDMKRLQGWSDVTVTHFHELAIYGEQTLLSIRFGDWIDINDQEFARNWARYWRPEIQRYIHAYNVVTGVDLAADITDVRLAENRYIQPAVLLSNRLAARRQPRPVLPSRNPGKQLPAPTRAEEFELDIRSNTVLTR